MTKRRNVQLSLVVAVTVAGGLGAWANPVRGDEAGSRPAGAFSEVVDVEVVNIEVFVNDKQGTPVTGLGREDFALFVDGEEVPVEYFYVADGRGPELQGPAAPPGADATEPGTEPGAPVAGEPPSSQRLSVVIAVDNDRVKSSNRTRVFRELRTFLDSELPSDARVAVASLNPELIIHSDLLSDRRAVNRILTELEASSDRPRTGEMEARQILGELSTTGRIYNRRDYAEGSAYDKQSLQARIRAYAEQEFNRSHRTLETLGRLVSSLAGVPGRKAMIYVSEGFVNRPGEDLFAALTYRYGDDQPAAQGLRSGGLGTDYLRDIGHFDLMPAVEELAQLTNSARISWYTIDAESDHSAVLRSAALRGGVASETFDALENNIREPAELSARLTGGRRIQASARLGADLAAIADFDTYYSLGFTPPDDRLNEDREIRVKVRGKGLVARYRQSYRVKPLDDRMADATVAALLYQVAENPLEIRLVAGAPQESGQGAYVLPVEVQIPLRNIVLVPTADGAHATQLAFYVTVKDRLGQPRRVQKLPFTASIPDEVLEQALGDSVRSTLPLVMRGGDQQVAVGVRDELGATEAWARLELTGPGLAGSS